MIFSSPEFVFLFLPLTVLLYYALLRTRFKSLVAPFIFASSLFYYACWRPQNIWIILSSITINYIIGQFMHGNMRKPLFLLGLAINIGGLGYFKYTDFALQNINSLLGSDFPMQDIILPLGISFFTFQQISYLSDIYTGRHDSTGESFFDYCCFICFFPQLVAGPIVHHSEVMPQFHGRINHRVNWQNIYNGIIIFCIGLGKKIILADQLSIVAEECFDNISSMTFLEAIIGSLCYTLQLYFDFSAYSDMAIGAALFFNIKLPFNFLSPYKADSIQDFWRRWHITLSRWLRDYVYIPLGGNRRGQGRTLGNLFLTFLLGGLWHGAAWTFVLWGALHGAALVIHRLWSKTRFSMPKIVACLVTFVFINFAWVFFRAPNMERLGIFMQAFGGYNGFGIREDFGQRVLRKFFTGSMTVFLCGLGFCLLLVFIAPNSRDVLEWPERSKYWLAVLLSLVTFFLMIFPAAHPQFIYSQF